MNIAIITGNVSQKPQLKAMPNGTPVANFNLATNRFYKDKDGNKQKEAEFHSIVVFGKTAENCAKYLEVGQIAEVQGRIHYRTTEIGGQKRYFTDIIASEVQFGAKPNKDTSMGQNEPQESIEEVYNNF